MATMRKVSIRQLRDNLSKELKELPIAIASDGQIVATILSIEGYQHLLKGYRGTNTDSSHKLSLYNPLINKAGDRVLVRQGKNIIETIIPELDGDGNRIPIQL